MKKLFVSLASLLLAAGVSAQEFDAPEAQKSGLNPQPRSFLSNVGLSLNAGTTGVGATLSTPLGKYFTARAGYGFFPYTYKHTEEWLTLDVPQLLADQGYDDVYVAPIQHDLDIKANLNVPAFHFLIDFSPTKQGFGAFHFTVGVYTGNENLLRVNGNTNLDRLQQSIDGVRQEVNAQRPGAGDIFDVDVHDYAVDLGENGLYINPDGTVDAYARVMPVRPYFGIGWGNAIPKGRVGFRFDIGAMYQGKPRIISPNIDASLQSELDNDRDLNEILGYAQFFPQVSLQLTFRLLKDK
jgi:hypothetical protein